MKNTNFLLLIFLLLINFPVFSANVEWKSGSIITNEGDTIHGTLGYRNGVGDYKECLFKKNLSDSVSSFTPIQIKAYIYDLGPCYESISLNVEGQENKYFVECLLKGIISLYYLEMNERKEFKYYYSLNALDGKKAAIYAQSKSYLEKQKIKKTLSAVFNYNPQLKEDIKKMNCSRSSFIALFKKYHDLTCTEYACISYQEPKYKFRYYITPYAGAQSNTTLYSVSWLRDESNISNFTPLLGVNFQMNTNKKSDRLAFNVGFNVSQIKMGRDKEPVFLEDYKAIQIANNIGAEFRFMNYKIRPLFEIGLAQSLLFETQNRNHTTMVNHTTGDDEFFFKKTLIDKYRLGFYLSTGILIPLKNDRAIPIKVTYSNYILSKDNSYSLSIGYTFRLK